jgi:UDP-N-acetylglucosamine/UDP-N-acetyl-alpha-D-glucosaminouronate 4-epimerase
MRVLVTGAAGFIGSRLCARLLHDGDEVIALDNLSEGSVGNLADASGVQLVEGDLRDAKVVRAAAHGCQIIYHQGAVRSVPRSMKQPELATDVNVRGTLNVLMAADEESARVVFASSSSVYGDQDTFPLDESFALSPRSPYAASKLAGEVYCQTWTRAYGVPTISLRYFNVYGPWQSPASQYAAVVPLFILACLRGEAPVIHGDGEQSRDFTFIDDVVEANVLSGRVGEEAWGRVFNIGGGQEPTSVNRVLAIVAELTGADPQPERGPPREGDVRVTEAAVGLARTLLGYDPRTSISDGLAKTVEWSRARHLADLGQAG